MHTAVLHSSLLTTAAGRPIPHVFGPRRPGDLDRVVAEHRRLKERLPWRPRYDELHAIVADTLRWEEYLSRRTTPDITG